MPCTADEMSLHVWHQPCVALSTSCGGVTDSKECRRLQRLAQAGNKASEKATRLAAEVTSLKAARVALMKEMKAIAAQTRRDMQAKTREVAALRKADRKKDVQMSRQASNHTKQTQVLQRKLDKARARVQQLQASEQRRAAAAKMRGGRSNRTIGGAGATADDIWTALSGCGDADVQPDEAVATTFHLTRVAAAGKQVPRVLAMAVQQSVNERWKRHQCVQIRAPWRGGGGCNCACACACTWSGGGEITHTLLALPCVFFVLVCCFGL